MKWFLAVKTMLLNMHINIKIIEDILFQQQTNKNTEEVEDDECEEATTRKPTCNEAIEHLNAL
jgi:formiminotetrahydrofolate cyclodeaminase